MINSSQPIKIFIILTINILSTFIFSSCSNDISDSLDTEYQNRISLSAYINENNLTAKMSGTSFDKNDAIGVYAVAYQNNNTTEGDIQDSYAPNVKHIYDGKIWTMPEGTYFPWAGANNKVVLYAYYPYSTSATNANAKNYPFSVDSNQQLSTSYYLSDFLWAQSEATTPTKTKVPLSFTHQMSKVVINIKSEKDFTTEEINNFSVYLLHLHLDGLVDLSTGNVSIKSSSTPQNINPYKRTNPTNGYDITLEGIILPQTISPLAELFSIQSTEEATPYIYRSQDELTFSSKKQYTFNITIAKNGISITTGDIIDWETTPDIDGNINQPVKKAVDISTINWNTTRVYKILDKGVQVGEITKEYLYSGNTIDRQAIVVYPMISNGVVDYTAGYVAQVMSASYDNNYDYNPDQNVMIHGGMVRWNGNQISYTAGKNAVINRIQIDKTTVSAAEKSAINTLELEPDLITDIDNNTYGIVKIGTQHWMRENLKVEHYRNGNPAEVYYYDNSIINKDQLGGLYTWFTTTNTSNIAPINWHVPNQSELTTLAQYVSGRTALGYAGPKLKATKMWTTIGNNLTGFSALPGGRRVPGGSFTELNSYGQWWTTTEYNTINGIRMWIGSGTADVVITYLNKAYTQSIRCIKD